MALRPNVQHISLASGMDEKIPREMLPLDKLAYVRNGRWRQPGMVETRLGYTTLSDGVAGGGTIPSSSYDRLLTRDGELCRLNEQGIYAYAPETAQWFRRDEVPEFNLYAQRKLSVLGDDVRAADMAASVRGIFASISGRRNGLVRGHLRTRRTHAAAEQARYGCQPASRCGDRQ
jgi:hypothetical protein